MVPLTLHLTPLIGLLTPPIPSLFPLLRAGPPEHAMFTLLGVMERPKLIQSAAPSSSTTYTASFTTQYSLTTSVNPSGAGTITPSGTNWYDGGQNVFLSATANPGYTFGAWSGDFSGTTNSTSIPMNGPKNVVANFTQNQYTLTVNIAPTGSGLVTKSP